LSFGTSPSILSISDKTMKRLRPGWLGLLPLQWSAAAGVSPMPASALSGDPAETLRSYASNILYMEECLDFTEALLHKLQKRQVNIDRVPDPRFARNFKSLDPFLGMNVPYDVFRELRYFSLFTIYGMTNGSELSRHSVPGCLTVLEDLVPDQF